METGRGCTSRGKGRGTNWVPAEQGTWLEGWFQDPETMTPGRSQMLNQLHGPCVPWTEFLVFPWANMQSSFQRLSLCTSIDKESCLFPFYSTKCKEQKIQLKLASTTRRIYWLLSLKKSEDWINFGYCFVGALMLFLCSFLRVLPFSGSCPLGWRKGPRPHICLERSRLFLHALLLRVRKCFMKRCWTTFIIT